MIVNVYSKFSEIQQLKSDLIVINIFDENNWPVDGVESDKKNWNENLADGLHLKKA